MKKLNLILIYSCSSKENVISQKIIASSSGPSLILSDEFNVHGAPSLLKWFLETIPPNTWNWLFKSLSIISINDKKY